MVHSAWTHAHSREQMLWNLLNFLMVCKEFMCLYASCSDCCIVLCWSWSVMVVVVVECCCCIPYRLALMLALTFATCTCDVILLSTSASTPLAHVVVTGCNLRWWHFSFSHWRKHSLHWRCYHLLQLVLVVLFLPHTGARIPLALEQLALCGSSMWMWRWWL